MGGAVRQEGQGYLLPTGVAASKALLLPREAAWQALGIADDISALPPRPPLPFTGGEGTKTWVGVGVLGDNNQVSTDGLLVEA